MIPYKFPEEKVTLQFYAELLGDDNASNIIEQDYIASSEQAIKFAEFFWLAVSNSNERDKKNIENSEYIFEKIIITLMAYFRSQGYEREWEEVCDRRNGAGEIRYH